MTIKLKVTIKGSILMFRKEFRPLFHFSEAESISLAESNMINAMTAKTPYSGSPIGVVKDMALVTAEDETALVVLAILEAAALDTAALETTLVVVADTVVADTTVVIIILSNSLFF